MTKLAKVCFCSWYKESSLFVHPNGLMGKEAKKKLLEQFSFWKPIYWRWITFWESAAGNVNLGFAKVGRFREIGILLFLQLLEIHY